MYYSQCGEDKYMYENYLSDIKNGIFIELGATDGVLYSNTLFLENLGWTGILIEPHPIQFKLLEQNRPRCKLYNTLISDNVSKPLDFKFFENHRYHHCVSGVVDTLPDSHNKEYFDNPGYKNFSQKIVQMIPKTLTEIVKDSGFKRIDFMSLDVEGHEYNVLNSYDFSVPITYIMVEALSESEDVINCRKLLQDKNYIFLEKYKHNEIYISGS